VTGIDDYDATERPGDDDYDGGLAGPAKEEPDCYTCSDSGCPDCGHIDPADPEHRQYVAKQAVLARGEGTAFPTLDELLPDATPEQRYACIEIIAVNPKADIAHVQPVTFSADRTVPVALSAIREQAGVTEVLPGEWYDAVVCGYAETAPRVCPDQWERSPELPDGWMGADGG
jgi:hypothetical protein